jgi:signal transduction histidine kinase
MQSFTRYLSFALIPLLMFLALAIAGQAYLQKETGRLQADAIAARQAQFAKAVALTNRAPETWDGAYLRDLGGLIGGTVTLETSAGKAAQGETRNPGFFVFDYPLPGQDGLHAHVVFVTPATTRLIILHQRMLATGALLALALIVMSIFLSLYHRPLREPDSRSPWPGVRSEMLGMEHFARMSVERSEALKRETGARHRAEEDLQASRTLLDLSMQERIKLGRDLHDNICQTLYAVSLSLEGVKRTMADAGTGTAGLRLDQCITELRRLNHEVRSFLKALEPGTVHSQPFLEALDFMLRTQLGDAEVRLVRNLDEEATALIAPERAAEVVNILREAVSNSLRHGRARTITVHAQRGDGTVLLAIQDDGGGFDPAGRAAQGHGLTNMQARAAVLGGVVKVVSSAGKGTRVLLTLPVTSAP